MSLINDGLFFLKKNRVSQKIFRTLNFYAFGRSLSHVQPLGIRAGDSHRRRINLIVPTICREHIFGGVATALRFYRELLEKLGAGACGRILVTEYIPRAGDMAEFPDYRLVSWEEESDARFQVLPVKYRAGRSIPMGAGDVFLATQWTTAYLAQRLVKAQADLYGKAAGPLVYLIQDFEPGFYPFSSEYLLSQSTYAADVSQVAIFNTSFLRDYFRAAGYVFDREYYFEPKLNNSLKKFLEGVTDPPKKKQILVYGRPSVPRNAFSLLLEGLRAWVGRQGGHEGWTVLSAGEKHPDVALGNGLALRSLGKLSLEQYARLLRESAVGVSLMVSPHPSYPPLEMAHFGMLTVTNAFANKDLSRWHENVVSLGSLTPETLAEALAEQCARFEADPGTGLRQRSLAPFYLDDSPLFAFLDELAAELFGGEGKR